MDVKKLSPLILFFLIISCNKREPANTGAQFNKSTETGCEENQIENEYLVRWKSGKITIEKSQSEDEFVGDFLERNQDEILSAEPHYRIQLSPNSELSQKDWGGSKNWGIDAIEAKVAWNKSLETEEIIVAVIDSGMDTTHPEFQNILAINEKEEINGIDDDGNGLIDDRMGYDFVSDSAEVKDYTGHGTHIVGVIAAQHDVGEILGVAPRAKILPLNFIGGNGGGTVLGAILAIQYAERRGAKVINASWGGSVCSLSLKDQIESLAQSNILFVAAAGNSGSNLDQFPEYPAAFILDNMITVGASTFDNKTAGFSNFGQRVDIMAPGANIFSTYPMEFDNDGTEDGIFSLNGTSMSAPFVTGAAALLWQYYPNASYIEIKQALLLGSSPGPYPVSTRSLLNIRLALQKMAEMTQSPNL